MKRLFSCLLICVISLSLVACQTESGDNTNFYYVRSAYVYGEEDGVIAAEARNTAEFTDVQDIMREYLLGPQDIALTSPFPQGIRITEFLYEGETLHITLSAHIVTLSKAQQVLACTCFARTVMELTGVSQVYFQTDNTDFAYMDPILIDRDSVLLYDDYNSDTTSERNEPT